MSSVQTVLGVVDASKLGRTLTHEHLILDTEPFFVEGPTQFQEFLNKKVSLENLGYVRLYPFSSRDNLRFNDDEAKTGVLKDVQLYKKFGGGSIVDNSSHGLLRDFEFLVELSKKTGVHIIAGTGHYTHAFQTANTANIKVEEMSELYTKDIVSGIQVKNVGVVKCGVIGEVGSNYPLHDFEKRAIRASAEVQSVLGCGVTFHPGPNEKAPFEIMRLYLEAGGAADKCVLSHLDRTISNMDTLLEFAKFGCFLQYDFFGTEHTYASDLNPNIDMISDAQRINDLIKLVQEGYVERILMSHDMHSKIMLTSFGGFGYQHIHMNVVPKLLKRGLTEKQVELITVTNPAEWLKFNI